MLDKCSAITVGQDGLNTLVTNLTQPSQQSWSSESCCLPFPDEVTEALKGLLLW